MEAIVLVFAFFAGLLSRKAGYPPLIGYLVAGFIANGLNIGSAEFFEPIADLGVLLLLFTIGLKLNLRSLMPASVLAILAACSLRCAALSIAMGIVLICFTTTQTAHCPIAA